jgi:hypothetical protein
MKRSNKLNSLINYGNNKTWRSVNLMILNIIYFQLDGLKIGKNT